MSGQLPRILVVDDVPENLEVVGGILDGKGVELSFATSGAQALWSVAVAGPDLILLDVAMPEMDGYETARKLKEIAAVRDVPIIFITARTRAEDVLEGFRVGAVDYVTKPFNAAELVARVFAHLELKRSRDTIAAQNESLRDLNASKDRLLSIIGHDLKNPLHGIISLSELVLDMGSGMDASQTKGHMSTIRDTAQHMAKTLNNLLDWARVQRGAFQWTPEDVVLSFMAEESILLIQSAAAAKGVRITNRIAPDERAVADPIMLLTILRNLLQNAVKYTPRGGQVTVCFERLADGAARISVTDTGIGMSAARVASLGEPGSRGSQPGTEGERGTGLGLLVCREFLARIGSVLEVTSAEGAGSTFAFRIPPGSAGPSVISRAGDAR
jgi:signal transduction histidine kinase